MIAVTVVQFASQATTINNHLPILKVTAQLLIFCNILRHGIYLIFLMHYKTLPPVKECRVLLSKMNSQEYEEHQN